MLGVTNDRFKLVFNAYDEVNKKNITLNDLKKWCDLNEGALSWYAIIYHDKDTELVNGIERHKNVHYHMCLEFKTPRLDSRIVNDIATSLSINNYMIQILPSYPDQWCDDVRYLCHMDEKQKVHYPLNDITTNSKNLFESYINYFDEKHLSFNTMFNLCVRCERKLDLYSRVGLKNAKLYQAMLSEVWSLTENARREFHDKKRQDK